MIRETSGISPIQHCSQDEVNGKSFFAKVHDYITGKDYQHALLELQFLLSQITLEQEIIDCYDCLFLILPHLSSDFNFGSLENNLVHLLSRSQSMPELQCKLASHLARAYARKGDPLHDRKAMFCLGKAVQIAKVFQMKEFESIHILASDLFERNEKRWTFKTKRYEESLEELRKHFLPLSKKEIEINSQEVRSIQKIANKHLSALFNVLLEDALNILGPAPCLYDIRAMGSVGREETCPYSDLEFMILIQDSAYLSYFEKLVEIIQMQTAFFTESQEKLFFVFTCVPNTNGFHIDILLQPKDSIKTPEAMAVLQRHQKAGSKDLEDIMLHMILKTISLASNDSSKLYLEYQSHLEKELSKEERAFQMILDDRNDYLKFWGKGFDPVGIDMKGQYVKFLNHLLSSMALFYGVTATNTLDIIDDLVDKHIFTKISGLILKKSVANIYAIRVRLHTEYKGQNEKAVYKTSDLQSLILGQCGQLDFSEKFSLEKSFWVVLSPLYDCLKSISSIKEFKRIFQEFDLLKTATSPSSEKYQRKLALDLAIHFTENGDYVEAIHCFSLQENTEERDRNASRLFVKILSEIHLSKFLENPSPSDETLLSCLEQVEKWEIFCTAKNDLEPFHLKMKQRFINLDYQQQQKYVSGTKILNHSNKPLKVKSYTTRRYREAYRLFKDSFKSEFIGRDLQRHVAESLKTFVHALLEDIFILLGKAPCDYDIRSCGSIAREEVYPSFNLEFMILIKDETKRPYFENLVAILEMQIASLGETTYLPHLFHSIPVILGLHSAGTKALILTPSAMVQVQKDLVEDPEGSKNLFIPSTSLCIEENPLLLNQYQTLLEELPKALSLEERACRFLACRHVEYQKQWAKPFNTETTSINLKNQYVELLNHLLWNIALYHGVKEVNSLDIIDRLSEMEIFTKESVALLIESFSALYSLRVRLQKEELSITAFNEDELFILEKCFWLILNPLYQLIAKLKPENVKVVLKRIDLFQIAFEWSKAAWVSEPMIRQIASFLYLRGNTTLLAHVDFVETIAKIKPLSENIYLSVIEKKDKTLHSLLLNHIYTYNLCYDACKAGNSIKLEGWLKKDRKRLDNQNGQGENFCFAAVEGNQLPLLQWLCKESPPLLKSCRKDGWTLMHLAASCGHHHIFNWLNEVDSHMIDTAANGMNPLHIAAYHEQTPILEPFIEKCKSNDRFLQVIVEKQCPKTIQFLFKNDLNPTKIYTTRKQTLLHFAAAKGQLENVQILHQNKVPIDARDMDKKTALFEAIINGHLPVVKYLIDNGADSFIRSAEGSTILHKVASHGHTDILIAVLNYPQIKELFHQRDDDERVPLHEAVRGFDKPKIVQILLEHGADPNVKNKFGFTPLHWAAQHGFIESAKILIEAGAEINALNKKGALPLDLAIAWGKEAFVLFFLGVKIDSNNNLGNSFEEKEKFYIDQLKSAQKAASYELQVFYLDQLSGLYVEKKEWKRSAKILNSAFAILEKHLHNPLFSKYLVARMERIEGLFLEDNQCKVSSLYRHYVLNHRTLLKEIRENCIKDFKKGSIPIEERTRNLMDHYQRLLRVLIQDSQELLGGVAPLEGWSCIGLGSMARGEVYPYSNLKFTFLIKNGNDQWLSYFKTLTQFLELRIINLGETPFIFDESGISPTLSGFMIEPYELINTPEGLAKSQENACLSNNPSLLQALTSISHIAGSELLTNECRKALEKQLKTTDGYTPFTGTSFYKKLSLKLLEPLFSLNANVFILEEASNPIDIEKELFHPFHTMIEGLALFYGVYGQQSTLQTIDQLFQRKIISSEGKKNLERAFRYMLYLQFEAHDFYKTNRHTIFHIELNKIQDPNCFYFDDDKILKLKELYQICIPFYRCMKTFFEKRKKEVLQKQVFYDNSFLTEGIAFQKKGDDDEAKKAFLKALSINPNDIEVLLKIGKIEERAGEKKNALSYYLKTLELTKLKFGKNHLNAVPYYQCVGNIYQGLEEYEEALNYHEIALGILVLIYGKNHPEVISSYRNLGEFCVTSEKKSKAIHYFKIAFELLCETSNEQEKIELLSKVIAIKEFPSDARRDLEKIYALCAVHFSSSHKLTKKLQKLFNI